MSAAIPLACLLLAPRTIRIMPLLGLARSAAERTLGPGRRIVDQGDPNRGVAVVDGVPQEVISYGDLTIIYVGGRVQCVQRDFGKAPGLSWQAALTASGVLPKGIVAVPDGGTLRLRGGAIPASFFVAYTGGKATIPERTLVVRAPSSSAFSLASVERKAVLDAIRPAFVRAFHGQAIKFVVADFGVAKGWAFVGVDPVAPSGKPLSFKRSDFADLERDGMIGGPAYVLLHQVGAHWRIVESVWFPTDVAWLDWLPKHPDASRAIFPHQASR